MTPGKTKNAALTTALAFHYQMLIGLDKCFSLEEGQSVWFEKDGDVSLMSPNILQSVQTEVKDYAAPLTDHHENLWKTLKNWIAPQFNHTKYGVLVLHTTQAFGATTRLKDWNSQGVEQRLQVLKEIFTSRSENERKAEKPLEIVRLQKAVLEDSADNTLKEVIEKVVLHVESDDLETLKNRYYNKLSGYIPLANRQAFSEGLIGFMYEQANNAEWVIEKSVFDQKRESLTAKWGPSLFTIPDFTQRNATEEEVESHITALFAQKICDIEHKEVLPEAIGDWLEYINSSLEELHGHPQYKKMVERYREQWIRKFSAAYRASCRRDGCSTRISQDLYDHTISEPPFGIDGYSNPDFVFRNGLIHEAMDDEDRTLKWKIEP